MIENIKSKLEKELNEKKFTHSIRVMEEAIKLAKLYGVDAEKSAVAGLLHDCGRFEDKSYLLKKSDEFGIILEEIYAKNVNLIHSYLGAELAKREYGVADEDIINAIRYHTTGRENMSELEKIVYMADYIEPYRNFDGIEEVRRLSYVDKDIDKALIKAIDNTIIYILNNGLIIHENTVKARNFLLKNKLFGM